MNSETSTKTPEELSNNGFEFMKANDYDSALPLFLRASELYGQKKDLKNQAVQLQMISEIYRLTNKISEALKTCEDLVEIYRHTEEYEQMFRVLNNMGLLEISRKKYEAALTGFKNALEAAERLNNKRYAALQSANIGSAYRDMNRSEKAIEYYEKSLGLYEESGQKEDIADQYTNIAYIHVVERRFKNALQLYQKALPIYMEIKNTEKAGFTSQNIEKLEAVIT